MSTNQGSEGLRKNVYFAGKGYICKAVRETLQDKSEKLKFAGERKNKKKNRKRNLLVANLEQKNFRLILGFRVPPHNCRKRKNAETDAFRKEYIFSGLDA